MGPKSDWRFRVAPRSWRRERSAEIRTSRCTRGVAEDVDAPGENRGDADPLEGLTAPRFIALERVPIRTRGSATTLSGWRLSAAADQGEGAIVLVDADAGADAGADVAAAAHPGAPFWRGAGVFLGWPAKRLFAAYAALLPESDERPLELNQLG